MRFITLAVIASLGMSSFAGPNENAKLSFDFIPATDAVDSTGYCPKDSTVTTSIKIHGASNLYNYELYVSFDSSSLQFVSAKQGSDDLPTMLQKNGGETFFKSNPSKKDSTKILISGTLLGDDESQCVSDSGMLCIVKFKHKKDDTTKISIASVTFGDFDETNDTTLHSSDGTIEPEKPIRVQYAMPERTLRPSVMVRNGSVSVTFPRKTEYSLTAVNSLGRQLYSQKGFSETARYDGHTTECKRLSSGMVFIRIQSIDNNLVIPLVL